MAWSVEKYLGKLTKHERISNMKITKQQLKQIIKEELEVTLNEGFLDRFRKKSPPAEPSAPTGAGAERESTPMDWTHPYMRSLATVAGAERESTPAEHLAWFFDKYPISHDARDTRILELTVQSFQEKGGDVTDKQAFIDFVAKDNPDKAAMMQKMLK